MRADLTLALIAFIWGTTFILVKRALDDVTPLLYLALRFSLAAAVLFIWFRRRLVLGFSRQEWYAGLCIGSVLMLGYVLQTLGLQTTTPSKSAFLTGLSIVLVPFVAAIAYRHAPRPREIAGVLVAGLGMGLLSMRESTLSITTGDLLTIGCAVAFAVHIVLLGHWAPRLGFASLSLLQIAAAAAVACIALPLVEQPAIHWSPAVIAAIGIGGILATALAFVLQTWAQERTTPTRAALLFSLEPVFAWIVSWLVDKEQVTQRAALGSLFILAGVLLVELKRSPVTIHPIGYSKLK